MINLIFWFVVILLVISIFLNVYFITRTLKFFKNAETINDVSFDLSGSAEQVSGTSRDLENASQEQLDSINSTMTASNEISSMVNRTKDHAQVLNEETMKLKEIAKGGVKIIDHMVHSSLEMKEGSEEFRNKMQESMGELTNSLNIINEIADKTKLINDIVFQTKLLSFNASVEAARAGEHGKGFAVVAEEVGKLAQMSGNAANEIATIVDRSIKSVTVAISNTKERVDHLTQSVATKIDLGYTNTKNCEEIFQTISQKISNNHQMVNEISVASSEQALGVEQLDRSINMLQEVANRNRLVASQMLEHSGELIKQTDAILECNKVLNEINRNKKANSKLKQFIWNDRLLTGVETMDEEHRILVGKINALVATLEDYKIDHDQDKLLASFSDMANYVVKHFKDEEELMRSIQYPQLNSHQKIHENLLGQVGKYVEQIKSNTLDDKKLVSFLRSWLLSHIMGVDMQYGAHYARRSNHLKIVS